MSGSIRRPLLALLLISVAGLAQSRPESAASRPATKVSVRQVPFPMNGQGSVPAGCSFSPDGRFLAVAGGPELKIFDFATRALMYEERAPRDEKLANWPPAFNAASNVMAYTFDRGIATVELAGGKWKPGRKIELPLRPWTVFPDPRTLAWSTDGKTMILVDWNEPRRLMEAYRVRWDSAKVEKLGWGKKEPLSAVFLGPTFGVSLKSDPGFETLILSDDTVVEHLAGIRILAVSGDRGSWLVARLESAGGTESAPEKAPDVELWDAKSRRARTKLTFHDQEFVPWGGVCHGAFSADGRLLVTGDDRRADIRDGRTGDVLHTIRHYEGDRIVALAISPDGRYLLTMGRPTLREDEGIVLWELTFE